MYSVTSSSSAAISSTSFCHSSDCWGNSASGTGEVEHLLDRVQQRERRLRVRRLGHVVRDAGPERDRRDARGDAGVLQDADDAGRALVADFSSPYRAADSRVVGRAGHLGRPGVRRVGEQRAERHDGAHVQVVDHAEQLAAEPAPAHVGLDPADEHQVEVGTRRAAVRTTASWAR